MANEKTTVKENVEGAAATINTPVKFDPYMGIRDVDRDTVAVNEGVETVYSKTGTDLYILTTPGTDKKTGEARKWFNFRIGYVLDLGTDKDGQPISYPQIVNFDPVSREKGEYTFNVIEQIYSGKNFYPADVVKTVREINGVETTSYSLRITYKTPSGVKLTYDFKTSKASDREVFENYIEYLRTYGLLK